MKKRRMLVFGLIAALLLTGAAYAAWTDSTPITVSASTGEVAVEISGKAVAGGDVSSHVNFTEDNVVIAADKKSAAVTITNLYPGAQAAFTVTIKNTGSLAVDLASVTHKAVSFTDLSDVNADNALLSNFDVDYVVAGTTYDSFNAAAASVVVVSDAVTGMVKDQTVDVKVIVSLDTNAPDTCQNKKFTFSVTPLFEQAS